MDQTIFTHFKNLGIPEEAIQEWWTVGGEKKPRTIQKLKENLPSKEELAKWRAAPHTLDSLRKIKLPLLCGWAIDEVITAMRPFIGEIAAKYKTPRNGISDCFQDGAIGVILGLKTDAGITPFSSHAYPRIRTSVRRHSATSGIISHPEKMPTQTEVRREITNWFLKQELLTEQELTEFAVQKIGRKGVKEKHVPESLRLNIIPLDRVLDLFDFLAKRFNMSAPEINFLKIRSVGDLVRIIATSPDFLGNPASLDSSIDETRKLINSIPAEQERPEEIAHKNLLWKIIEGLIEDFTPSQKMVLYHTYGLHGKIMLANHEIADQFGTLLEGVSRKVARQRITQYQKAVLRKFRIKLCQKFRVDLEDRYFRESGKKLAMEDIPEDLKNKYMDSILT